MTSSTAHFADIGGATSWHPAGGSGTAIYSPSAGSAHGTTELPDQSITKPPSTPDLAEWLDSDDAQQYAGQWVLLSNEFVILDADASPAELLYRHPEMKSPRIIFVQPRGVRLTL